MTALLVYGVLAVAGLIAIAYCLGLLWRVTRRGAEGRRAGGRRNRPRPPAGPPT